MTVLQLTAVGSTAFRLYYRHKTHRLWWDDYTAVVPLVGEFIYIPVLWMRIVHSGDYAFQRYLIPGSLTWETQCPVQTRRRRLFCTIFGFAHS